MSVKKAPASKDTIYIDADDEITFIIDKVRSSNAKIIALVLPKRAATLHSIVNLKLLKRTATEARKNLVLVTSDPGLLPIAGAAGMLVSKTLQSKPVVPESPALKQTSVIVENEVVDEPDMALDPRAPIGQLAGHVATEETIDLDNDEPVIDNDAVTKIEKDNKKSINKKLKIPNFDRFRVLLFCGIGLLILLIVGGVFAFVILPKAKIVIKTDTTNVSTTLRVTAKVDAKSVDREQLLIPAINKQLKKTDTEKTPATGQRDEGNRATGTVTITNCNKDNEDGITLPAGTVLSTTNAGTAIAFVTTETVAIPQSNFTLPSETCKNDSFRNVGVVAQGAGGQYNLSANRQFSIAISGVSGTGSSAMTGGTSKLVQVASQADIDKARQKIIDRLTTSATNELKTQFASEKLRVLPDTFTASPPVVVSTPNVNEPATDVNVSATITFGQIGVKEDDLKELVETDIKKHIDVSKQVIQDNGLSNAVIQILEKTSANEIKFEVKALAIAGPQLDADGIKKQIAGKKKGEAQGLILARPGIKDVTITYSPFWVYSTPKNQKHITITFDQNNANQ